MDISTNKQWFIKINKENNLYYDSESKEYRLRLFCPNCHKPSICVCYKSYEDYEYDIVFCSPTACCSYLCCLIMNSDTETENMIRAAQDLGIGTKSLDKYTEQEAKQIIDLLFDECIWDLSEYPVGKQCDT